MTQTINQFTLGKEKGQLDMSFNTGTISARAAGALTPGQPVKMTASNGLFPYVEVVTDDTTFIFGYVNKSTKKTSFVAGDHVDLSVDGNVMYLEAGGTIAAGDELMWESSTDTMVAATGTSKVVSAIALDKATSGGIFRAFIKTLIKRRPLA